MLQLKLVWVKVYFNVTNLLSEFYHTTEFLVGGCWLSFYHIQSIKNYENYSRHQVKIHTKNNNTRGHQNKKQKMFKKFLEKDFRDLK